MEQRAQEVAKYRETGFTKQTCTLAGTKTLTQTPCTETSSSRYNQSSGVGAVKHGARANREVDLGTMPGTHAKRQKTQLLWQKHSHRARGMRDDQLSEKHAETDHEAMTEIRTKHQDTKSHFETDLHTEQATHNIAKDAKLKRETDPYVLADIKTKRQETNAKLPKVPYIDQAACKVVDNCSANCDAPLHSGQGQNNAP